MYKIIIIDSDTDEAKSLSKMVGDDFSVVNIFKNAESAFSAWDDAFDIVIIDGKTQEADISKIISHGCEVLMLCAYQDLPLAKTASDLGVGTYLLKPIRFDEFSYALATMKLAIERRNISRLHNAQSLDFNQFLPILREQFFSEIANGKISSRVELRQRATELSMEQSICGMPCVLLEVKITEYHDYITNKWKYGRDTLYTAIKNLLSDNDQFSFQAIMASGSTMLYVVLPSKHISMKTLGDTLRAHILKSTRSAFELFGMLLFFETKRFFSSLFEMMEYSYKNIGLEKKDTTYEDNAERIISELKLQKTANSERILDAYAKSLGSSNPENTATFLLNLMTIVCERLFSGAMQEQMKARIDKTFVRQGIENNEIFEESKLLLSEFVSMLRRSAINSDEIVITKAKRFINENFQNDISLADVAKAVYLNPIYFSRMFKAKTNENFSAYLLRVRMKPAADLLEHGEASVTAVARAVGFKNTKYFSRLFKQFSGSTPREYLYIHLK